MSQIKENKKKIEELKEQIEELKNRVDELEKIEGSPVEDLMKKMKRVEELDSEELIDLKWGDLDERKIKYVR